MQKWQKTEQGVIDRYLKTFGVASYMSFCDLISERLNRLLSVAFCYNGNNNLTEDQIKSLQICEDFADNNATDVQRIEAFYLAVKDTINNENISAFTNCSSSVPIFSQSAHYIIVGKEEDQRKQIKIDQAKLLASVIGLNWKFKPIWRTDTVVTLAQQIYETKDWKTIPILADALQDAGCDDPFLEHMRSPESRFCRGYWVLDKILQKR